MVHVISILHMQNQNYMKHENNESMQFRYYMKCKSCNIETKLENNNSERKHTKKPSHLTHNLDSTGHVISKLHDGRSCNIETIYQPILAVTDLPKCLYYFMSSFAVCTSVQQTLSFGSITTIPTIGYILAFTRRG